MGSEVIVTITLNAALHVSYAASGLSGDAVNLASRPRFRASGRGITAAKVLHAFGHDVLAAGFAGGQAGELIRADLARSGVPAAFTHIRGESRRLFSFSAPDGASLRFAEPGPYITTEELGRFAADYRRLLPGAAAVVLSGSLPDGLPPEMYGTLVTYAAEAGVPAILDAGGEEMLHGVAHRPDLVVTAAAPGASCSELGAALIRRGAGAVAVATDGSITIITATGTWTGGVGMPAGMSAPALTAAPGTLVTGAAPGAGVTGAALGELVTGAAPGAGVTGAALGELVTGAARGALVAGMVPGYLLGWSWPDRLRHSLALAAAYAGEPSGDVDLGAYERLLDAVRVQADAPRQRPHRSGDSPAERP